MIIDPRRVMITRPRARPTAIEAKLEALVERVEELDLGAGDRAVRTIILAAECLLELGEREVTISASRLLLPWSVDVLASGGWTTLARFASETDAWIWARRWIDALVYVDDSDSGERHCQGGVRDGAVCSAERALEGR